MTTDIEKKIIKQVEYYFGDNNLPRDRFLQEQMKLDDGWITLETMIKFNRLKQITEDTAAIAEALKKSTTGLLEIHSENTKIRRSPDKPIPDNSEERRQEMSAKTIYAIHSENTKIRRSPDKPIPDNSEERRQEMSAKTIYAKEFPTTTTLEALQEFFEGFGTVENIFMRKNEKKAFKGSVFVTFTDDESVKKFLEPESVKFGETELEKRMTKSDYYKMKGEEKKKAQQEKADKKLSAHHRQLVNEVRTYRNEMQHGTIMYLTNFADGTSREDIRNLLQDYAPIHWIDFNKGETEAFIRYDKENQAKEALEKALAAMNNEIMLNGNKLETRVLEGEEEEERWKKMYEQAKERLEKKRNTKNFQKGRWGKRPGKAKREAAKQKKLEEEEGANNTEATSEANGKGDAEKETSDEPPEKKMKLADDVKEATAV